MLIIMTGIHKNVLETVRNMDIILYADQDFYNVHPEKMVEALTFFLENRSELNLLGDLHIYTQNATLLNAATRFVIEAEPRVEIIVCGPTHLYHYNKLKIETVHYEINDLLKEGWEFGDLYANGHPTFGGWSI